MGLLAGTLYLLDFIVSNTQLAGLVDGTEACGLAVLSTALPLRGPAWLPVLFVLGTVGKETFVPIAVVLARAWWLAGRRDDPGHPAEERRVAAGILAGLAAATVLISTIAGELVWPWVNASVENSHADPLASTARILFKYHDLVRLRLAAAGCALALSIYRECPRQHCPADLQRAGSRAVRIDPHVPARVGEMRFPGPYQTVRCAED